ncbi:MAG: DUF1887 family CARF protein [Ruminococcus sp.]
MTYIEFFDKDDCENICSSLQSPPDRVILVGDRKKLMEQRAQRYRELLKEKGAETAFECVAVNKNDMREIVKQLSAVIEKYGDCVFDLTGGDELYLVATGIVFERYRDRNIQMHRVNLRNGVVTDCDCDGNKPGERKLSLTVEEYIRLYGGSVVYDDTVPDATFRWKTDREFRKDVGSMWEICRKDPRLWNAQIGVLAALQKICGGDGLTAGAPEDEINRYLKQRNAKMIDVRSVFGELERKGLLQTQRKDGIFSVAYKNAQVKRCLTKAGQVLEMKVFLAALEATEKNGERSYDDVMNGVYIDWDGTVHAGQDVADTENEIDVMMMYGMIPVFVSCKNGVTDINELYKLDAVAARFGGAYAKRVVVATSLGDSMTSEYFRMRAADMNIRLVENVQELNDREWNRALRSFRQ